MPLCTPLAHSLRVLQRRTPQFQCLRAKPQCLRQQGTLITKQKPPADGDRMDPLTLHRLEYERVAYYKRRSYYAAAGVVFGMVGIWVTATSIELPPNEPTKLDSGKRADDPLVVLGRERKVVVQKLGEEPEEVVDTVETGTSTVPTFPRVLDFSDDVRDTKVATWPAVNDDTLTEYQLLGLGIRTVSFLGIQVYVVGMYIATDDIAKLQHAMIRKIDPIASTLVAGEKEKLEAKLYDSEEGAKIWDSILKDAGIRTLIRIVPTRNTDFHHLRDAWVRSLTARAQAKKEEYGDEKFGASLGEFKQLFNRGSVPKGRELLLCRYPTGKVAIWYDDGKNGATRLGQVEDERISRGLWLNYLGGKQVSSEGARKSIIEGVMEFVERPVGTVATQVDLSRAV
ncbi:putative altered inheritance of mitochondria protein 18, mitochondrial [Amylocarpus encephaloides]|uniref:Altered inheritance of mitochondria protein 18, mitochondrial n=1 Tax=Amylocarpus encephaloides TaxID=45428 RepID=A0A9P8C1E4_9HELO|nr:putative altered inheritance of mitochondria protein 18, mitochondrial [Amylocarpus encephaloides]